MGMTIRHLPEPLPAILERFVADVRATLGDELVGAYAYGSAIVGDFDPERSDLDVCVVTRSMVDALPIAAFEGLIARLAGREPEWAHRLDVVFAGTETLASFRAGGALAWISHDEPLQRSNDADGWLQTWYLIRTADVTLAGPPIAMLIPPIEDAAFVAAIATDTDRVQSGATAKAFDGLLAYVFLTHARVLAALDGAGIVSKLRAARRLVATHPQLAPTIAAALRARNGAVLTSLEREAIRGASESLAAEIRQRR